MRKRILTISLVLVMVLSFTACGEELPPAQEIVDGVIASEENIRTYQFDSNEIVDMAIEGDGEEEDSFTLSSSGTIDIENRRLRVDTSISETGQPEIVWGGEQYFIDGMLYVKPKDPEGESEWMKEEVPEEWWEGMLQMGVESQIELLEAAQVDFIGSEKVGGIDCWVLQVTMDMEQLWQFFMQQAAATWVEMPDVEEGFLQEIFRSFSVKQWIAKDTYFLTKADMDVAMELTPDVLSYLGDEGEMSMDITLSFLAYNYNQPVSIELPPEAEEAIEVPME